MPRLFHKVLSLFLLYTLLSGFSVALAEAVGDLTLTNKADKTLCVYVGNNVLTCHFKPKSVIHLKIPTKVLYSGQPASVSTIKVTNASSFIANPDGTKTQQNISLCQSRDFTGGGPHSQWDVTDGKSANCSVKPIYSSDSPNRSSF